MILLTRSLRGSCDCLVRTVARQRRLAIAIGSHWRFHFRIDADHEKVETEKREWQGYGCHQQAGRIGRRWRTESVGEFFAGNEKQSQGDERYQHQKRPPATEIEIVQPTYAHDEHDEREHHVLDQNETRDRYQLAQCRRQQQPDKVDENQHETASQHRPENVDEVTHATDAVGKRKELRRGGFDARSASRREGFVFQGDRLKRGVALATPDYSGGMRVILPCTVLALSCSLNVTEFDSERA